MTSTLKNARWDEEIDVGIVGAGGAGLAAAIESADTGAKTVAYEKQPALEDSSSALCGGLISFSGTATQASLGIKDSDDLHLNDLLVVGHHQNRPEILKVYMENQLDTYTWLTAMGVKWISVIVMSGMSAPRGHNTDPVKLVNIMRDVAEKKGARVLLKTPVTDLLTEDGKVSGLLVAQGKGTKRVKTRKGVIMASGGFGRNPEMLARINPHLAGVKLVMGKGHTGDCHRWAEKLGAYFIDMENVKPTFGVHVDSDSLEALCYLYYIGAIIVNKRGERFVDESLSYKEVGKAALAQPDGVGYQIIDRKLFESAVKNAKGVPSHQGVEVLDELRLKLLIKGNTMEELAARIGVNPKTFTATMNNYNRSVDTGDDKEFGRKTLVAGFGKTVRLDTPPFYAFPSMGMLVSTYAGIAVDPTMRVLTKSGPIDRLFAAGELMGGFHGASYMSGSALGKAIIFGRIAGRNAAKLASR